MVHRGREQRKTVQDEWCAWLGIARDTRQPLEKGCSRRWAKNPERDGILGQVKVAFVEGDGQEASYLRNPFKCIIQDINLPIARKSTVCAASR